MLEPGSPEKMPVVNARSIDNFGDFTPESDGPHRQLIIEGQSACSFEGHKLQFRTNTRQPNIRLQTFNVVLGMVIEGDGSLITPNEMIEKLVVGEDARGAVRRSLFIFTEAELLQRTVMRRRWRNRGSVGETQLQAPVDVAVTYKNRQTEKLKPKRPHTQKPKIDQGLVRPKIEVPKQNPKHSDAAACRGKSFDIFYPGRGKSVEPAKLICSQCVQKDPCLEYALAHYHRAGVWGGTSARERREIARLRALAQFPADTEAQPEL